MFKFRISPIKGTKNGSRLVKAAFTLVVLSIIVGLAGDSLCIPQPTIARAADPLVPIIITLKDQPFSWMTREVRPRYEPRFRELTTRLRTLGETRAWDGIYRTEEEERDYVLNRPATKAQVLAQQEDLTAQLDALDDERRAETVLLARPLMEESQRDLVRFIEQAGGRITYQFLVVNSLAAQVPADLIPGLRVRPEVAEVSLDQLVHAHLNVSARTIFADTWWGLGRSGGSYDIGVIDSGVDPNHPALTGRVTGQRFGATADAYFHDYCPGWTPFDDPSADDVNGHGTHVAGIVASDDGTYRGIAHGLDAVLNGKAGFHCPATGGAAMYDSDSRAAIDWTLTGAGIEHADAINLSYGGAATADDGHYERFMDAVVNDEGVLMAIAAGNDGPYANTIGSPSIAYNVLSVANMDDQNTFSRRDDLIRWSSSRGPTPGGRRKPDITAPGTGIMSANSDWEGAAADFVPMTGTSMAAPHVAGALIILRQSGISDPKSMKALLINTAQDRGATGWDATYGWGYLDLLHANYHVIHRSSSLFTDSIGENGDEKFYRGAMYDNDRASLVWNRRVVYNGSSPPSTYYDLSNLDLYLYDDVTNALISSSTSSIDNVEQVGANADYRQVVIKVRSFGVFEGTSTESYTLATEEGFVVSTGPVLYVKEGELIRDPEGDLLGTITVGNEGDLTAHNVQVVLGLALESIGTATVDVGRLAPGEAHKVSWKLSLRGATVPSAIPVVVISESYDSAFQAQGKIVVHPDTGGKVYLPVVRKGR